ncbi:hypothetical protein J3L18_28310 [Mucilaginibacter gossypii]|uniref:hypothetical protein n=1 Tax=Mucilaginibacter gossypii TaxID=551996 RepID=UPI001AA18300|nr:hypothetical protein [Mucilaginibacter gossypii]QTE36971.1 hypothetical protein J3L18_28310 [Mucilaginibacter gossypii]
MHLAKVTSTPTLCRSCILAPVRIGRDFSVATVIGTLVEYLGMRKVNTIGIELANKCMLMAGIAYNLKKLIKYEGKSFLQVIMSLLEAFKSSRFYYT